MNDPKGGVTGVTWPTSMISELHNLWTSESRYTIFIWYIVTSNVLHNGRWITRKIHYTLLIYDYYVDYGKY